MQIPETPRCIEELDLMERLDDYGRGVATCNADGSTFGPAAQQSCRTLHSNLVRLVNEMLGPLLDRVSAREMETFTMHDRTHGLKVAHLMWHILTPARRERLTPPEIALLVSSAFLHDVGMALNADERAARLDPTSDLWERLELDESQKEGIQNLRAEIADRSTTEVARERAAQKLAQAEEGLLCQDTRDHHSTAARYNEVLKTLDEFHQADRVRIPDIETCLSSDGNSFRSKLIEICVSHNEDAESLVKRDETNPERPRFPTEYPVSRWNADLHMVAAALRLADVLDFDRERTPALLYHYLLPGSLDPYESKSVLEWGKHLAISNWHIDSDAIVFRGQSKSHVLHHAVVHFCRDIAKEIEGTRATFGALADESSWPFALPAVVKPDIHEDGYRYVPYQFELDDERVYQLLMGGAIYDNPLVAVRELVQDAVDACKLRDALTQLSEPSTPKTTERIFIRYEEPTRDSPQPRLSVTDTGTGMDALVLERYFLKVGRSFYSSSEFNRQRVLLRKNGLDFAPISEFGIGFLSCFLLSDHIEVETAMWDSLRGDTKKRTLFVDGPTRLIRLSEEPNEGIRRFKGTRVTLFLVRGAPTQHGTRPPTWLETERYLTEVCLELPYPLHLQHAIAGKEESSYIRPRPLTVELFPHLEPHAYRIPVSDEEAGLEGEIVLINSVAADRLDGQGWTASRAVVVRAGEFDSYDEDARTTGARSSLLRGGFRIGDVPGEPGYGESASKVRLTWDTRLNHKYLTPNLARNALSDEKSLAHRIFALWFDYLVSHWQSLPDGLVASVSLPRDVSLRECTWMQKYDGLTLYNLCKTGWIGKEQDSVAAWEDGTSELEWPYFHGLGDGLLDYFLPRVAATRMDVKGFLHVKPPMPNWRDVLAACHDHVTGDSGWRFTEYPDELAHLLLFMFPRYYYWYLFNARFRDRLNSFNVNELGLLGEILSEITERPMVPALTSEEFALLLRLRDVAGDLGLGTGSRVIRLDEIKVEEVAGR